MAENREASYTREAVQPPKTALDHLSYADIAKQSLLPEEIEFLSTYFNNGALEQTLQAKIGLENYIDRWFHWAVFEVPGKDQVAKLPLNKENLETIGAEMARHDAFQGAFDDIKISYPTLISEAWFTQDIVKLRREAANNIYVPERRQIPERNDVYVMDRVKGAEPVDYFKQVAIIRRDFPDYIERNGINLDWMNAAAMERFTTWIYEKHGKPKPNVSEISVSVIPKEQLNALVDMVRALNKNGTYHGDLHQGNILIWKEPIGTNGMRQIHLIDFGTAWKQWVSWSPQKIEKSLSIPKWRELEELMEKYPNEPPDVIRVMHTLGSAISPNK